MPLFEVEVAMLTRQISRVVVKADTLEEVEGSLREIWMDTEEGFEEDLEFCEEGTHYVVGEVEEGTPEFAIINGSIHRVMVAEENDDADV